MEQNQIIVKVRKYKEIWDINEELWNHLDDLFIKRLEKFEEPLVEIHTYERSIIIEYWDSPKPEDSFSIEIENCHITDDGCAEYFRSLAVFLNEIRGDILLCDNFYFGLCFNEETDEIYYDEDQYLKELEILYVSEIIELEKNNW